MANMTFKASLLPNTDLEYSLGSETQRWKINGYDPDARYVNITGDTMTGNLIVKKSGANVIVRSSVINAINDNDCRLTLNFSDTGSQGLWSSGYSDGTTYTASSKWLIVREADGDVTVNGNASTATKLATARTLKIGTTGKTFDGSANVTWTHAEIGATVSNAWNAGTTAGPAIKTTVNGVTGTAVAIPTATASASGAVTTGAQTWAGNKTFNGVIYAKNSTRWPTINFVTSKSTNPTGAIIWTGANTDQNITQSQIILRAYSYTATASANALTYYEDYVTPNCTAGRTGSVTYQLLTTKSAVTIAQGGTGATTADQARTNLGAAAASHTHSYLPLSGGTMTGNITMSASKYLQKAGQAVSWVKGRDGALIKVTSYTGYNPSVSMKTTNGSWEIGVYTNNNLWFTYATDTNYNANTNTVTQTHIDVNGHVWGAVWNDYAEMREIPEEIEPGRCVREVGDDTMVLSTARLQRGCKIISDTFGFNIGETENAKTPIAVSGRALVYLAEGREAARTHIGWPVCSGPDGTVSIMTEEEEEKYPSRIVGTISSVPDYEEWGTGKVKVNGRIWIYVR